MKETYILSTPLAEDSISTISYNKQNLIDVKNDKIIISKGSKPFTYEEAISATGFGKFNILLLFVTIPSAAASIFTTTSMSYILSEAQCDLRLSLEDKGLLNAITYIGMICSAFLWGTVGDNYGRRTVLLYSYSFDSVFMFIASISQTKWMLLTAKFFSGFMMSGPISVLMSYISEFHNTNFRPQLITILGVNYGIARTLLPLYAWAIFPLKLHFVVIEDVFEVNSWQIYLLLCCVPSTLSAIVHFYLPETPKFLMTKGRFDEALVILRKIYTINTNKDPKTLPFSELIDDTFVEENVNELKLKSKLSTIWNLFRNVKPLFCPPYLYKTFLMCGIFFGGLLSGNTLRLWLPQLFTTMDEFIQNHENTNASLCEMLDYTPKNNNTQYNSTNCIVPEVTSEVYINNIIVPISSIIGYFIIATLVKTLGKKTLLVCQYIFAGLLVIANFWSKTTLTTVILSSFFLTFFSICATTATGIAVELYPTNLRTMATSIFLLCGRIGSILGNTLFPILLYTGCLPPFLFIGGFMFLCAVFSLMLPGTENKPLQ